ncbi:hypothetical protein GYA28_04290 [Candidatus Roizmanbacteria bacterium]|jgi:xanthine phosphoribosyltransferase|nr:hypothetical protein [Candidatus Roizmanbacteria bacterium]
MVVQTEGDKIKASILDTRQALEIIGKTEVLTPAGRLLAENVINLGRVFPLEGKPSVMVLDVKAFLNHRVDTKLMMMIGKDLAHQMEDLHPDFVLTAPSSGITPAFAVAHYLGDIPLIYTQKSPPVTFNDSQVLETDSFSYTTGTKERMTAAASCIPQGLRGVGVDDFSDTGKKSTDLLTIAGQAGAELVGFGYAIEKSAYGGRKKLIDVGLDRVHSVLDIEAMRPGKIMVKGIPYWLSLANNGGT